jgi:hypothetical protein
MHTSFSLALRVGVAVVLASLPARADSLERVHELSIGSTTRALRTDSANALTDDSLGGGALTYAHALPLELMPGLLVWGQATLGWGGADGMMFQTLSTELDTLSVLVGGRARYVLHPRVIASGRLQLGMARAGLTIRDGAYVASDAAWGPVSETALGVDLLAVNARRFKLGVRFELGLVASVPVGLAPTAESGSAGTLQLEMSTSEIGSLNLSGTTLGISVVSQF